MTLFGSMGGLSASPRSLAIQLEEHSRLLHRGRKDNFESNLSPIWLRPAEAIAVVMVVIIMLKSDYNCMYFPYSR